VAAYFEQLNQYYNDEADDEEWHDPGSEPVPPLPQYMLVFAHPQRPFDKSRSTLQTTLNRTPSPNTCTKDWLQSNIPLISPPIRIAISGNSGLGKSTMIYVMLGIPTLCPTVSRHQSIFLRLLTHVLERQRCWHACTHRACSCPGRSGYQVRFSHRLFPARKLLQDRRMGDKGLLE